MLLFRHRIFAHLAIFISSILTLGLVELGFLTTPIYANPSVYITGNIDVLAGVENTYEIHLDTDGNAIGALQIAIEYEIENLTVRSISILSSVCSIWAPANSIPPGQNFSRVTPYAYNGRVIFTCGFTGSGYTGSNGLIGKIVMMPTTESITPLELTYPLFEFLGSSIAAGAMDDFNINVIGTIQPTPTPTVSPSPNPLATATPTPTATSQIIVATSSATVTPTPIINSTTIFDDVTVVDVSGNFSSRGTSSTTTRSSNNADLSVVEEDDTIPAPPNLTPRPSATSYPSPDINFSEPSANAVDGEVLSVQGLRDLIIPGKSKADRTLVMVNFISTILFLLLLAFLLWKVVTNTRASRLKAQHIQEMITGELAALESKMSVLKEKAGDKKFEAEFSESVSHIIQEVNHVGKPEPPSDHDADKPKST